MYAKLRADLRGYAVKNLKTWTGREGGGFACTLYRDGNKLIEVRNNADGGGFDYERLTRADERAALATLVADARLAEAEGAWHEEGESRAPDPYAMMTCDMFVSMLIGTHEQMKAYERRCKKGILFTRTADDPGTYREIKARAFTPAIGTQLRAMYPDLESIVNEEVAAAPAPYVRPAHLPTDVPQSHADDETQGSAPSPS